MQADTTTCYRVGAAAAGGAVVPIGTPVMLRVCVVLGEQRELLPIGATGLCNSMCCRCAVCDYYST